MRELARRFWLALALLAFVPRADAQQFAYDRCGQLTQGSLCVLFVDTEGDAWFLDPAITNGKPLGVDIRVQGVADPLGGGMCVDPHGSISLAVVGSCFGPYTDVCSGDGGDQSGCTDCPCGNNAPSGTTGGCLNSTGNSARLAAEGDASVSLAPFIDTDLRFSLSGAPPSALCVLTSGDLTAPDNPMNPCFGSDSGIRSANFDGLRCAVLNIRRHGARSADALGNVGGSNGPWGGEGFPVAGIAHFGNAMAAGQTRTFQIVHREDALLGCMRGLGTSQGVVVTFTP